MSVIAAPWDLRLGRWEDVLDDIIADAIITDAPYSQRTHDSRPRRNDGANTDGISPSYQFLTPADVQRFVEHWSPRCRGWMVSITDDVLAPVWRDAYRSVDRYAFAAVPCVITGMSCRLRGDGPSSWAVYAMVSRPKTKEFSSWGTLPGAYCGPRSARAKGGRGKPSWLLNALIRHYTRAGDLVVDPYAGWATTLAAAVLAGRRAVGAELDADVRRRGLAALTNLESPACAPRARTKSPRSATGCRMTTIRRDAAATSQRSRATSRYAATSSRPTS